MYCPNCRTEYKKDIQRCADCGADLVEALPDPIPPEYQEYEPILSTMNPADIAIIKSILDEGDIEYYFHGENSAFTVQFGVQAVLMVRKDDAAEVRELLKDLPILFSIHLWEDDKHS